MKTRYWLVIIIVMCVLSSVGTYFGNKKFFPVKPKVIKETITITEHIPVPGGLDGQQLCEWYEQCQKSDITIRGEFDEKEFEWFNVTAADQCKHAHKRFKMGIPQKTIKHEIGIGPGALLVYDFRYRQLTPLIGATIQYTHWWSNNLGMTIPIKAYGAFDSSMFAVGADVFLNYRW